MAFYRMSPEAQQYFLESLGMDAEKISKIRWGTSIRSGSRITAHTIGGRLAASLGGNFRLRYGPSALVYVGALGKLGGTHSVVHAGADSSRFSLSSILR